jgi:hypothetical protein
MRLLLLVLLLAAAPAYGQAPPLRLFLDCQNTRCDFDYLRTEIDWVSYVRDRVGADVHALVTSEPNGAGGRTYFVRFEGREAFDGVDDELTRATGQDATEDDRREALASVLRAGLVRYLARTDAASRLRVGLEAASERDAPEADVLVDPWNFWVFRIGSRGFVNGDANYTRRDLNLNFSANRTTETLKTDLYANGSQNVSRFTFTRQEDGETVEDVREIENNNYNAGGELVFSVGPHWSVGGSLRGFHSTFTNTDLSVRAAPQIEYSVFPYAQTTERAIRIAYSIGARRVAYRDTTLYDEIAETLFDHELEAGVGYQQPWGSVSVNGEATQFLHDLAFYSFNIGVDANLRLVRGLRFDIGGNYSRIRDQLNLPRGSASEEDVLTRRRQLATGYDYFFSVGLSYTFGSAFNSVVNPRFDRVR